MFHDIDHDFDIGVDEKVDDVKDVVVFERDSPLLVLVSEHSHLTRIVIEWWEKKADRKTFA